MNDLDWKQPALIGGLIVGIFSAIPGISALNCCFCAWALIGGAVAAKMVIGRSQRPVKTGEGAQIGLMAGLIGAVAFILVSIPIILSGVMTGASLKMMEGVFSRINNPELQEAMRQAMEQATAQTPGQRLISTIPFLLVQAVVLGGFTVLGGLLGIALFEKRKDLPPPQYPPPYPPQYPPQQPPQYPPQGGWPPQE
jgi:hypothetical protein